MNELTPDQEQFIRDNYAKMSDLNELTRNCYNDPSLDGRTKEGRLVRKFLIDNKFQYSTTKKIKSDEIGLSSAQKEFILLQILKMLVALFHHFQFAEMLQVSTFMFLAHFLELAMDQSMLSILMLLLSTKALV